ncbi:MAG TPA: hypothetical protein VNT03_00205 [Baekduia sp.]|nr:hypothetical protein [Baekduia sp.]
MLSTSTYLRSEWADSFILAVRRDDQQLRTYLLGALQAGVEPRQGPPHGDRPATARQRGT